jgi:hypothetical protein
LCTGSGEKEFVFFIVCSAPDRDKWVLSIGNIGCRKCKKRTKDNHEYSDKDRDLERAITKCCTFVRLIALKYNYSSSLSKETLV